MTGTRPLLIPANPRGGYLRAIHLRVTELEAAGLEAHAKRLAQTRNTQVSLSEAVRDLLSQALGQQVAQPWETTLKALPFVTWSGAKPCLPPASSQLEDKSLADLILDERGKS